MALPPLRTKHPELAPLAPLSNIQKGGVAYYRELAKNADPIVAAGAWCAMFDAKLVTRLFAADVLPHCRFGAVRKRAYAFFRAAHEHTLARAAADVPATSAPFPEQLAMQAEIAQDHAAESAIDGELFLATGNIEQLLTASEKAEAAGGWRPALEWALRAMVLAPLSPEPLRQLFEILDGSAQADLMEEVGEILQGRNLHVQTAQVFLAAASSMWGDAKLCLTRLKPLDDARLIATPALALYLGTVRALRAQSEEKLGNFRRAYESYAALNAAERSPNVDPEFVYKGANLRARLAVPLLPADGRPNVVQMLGFPRSGTTLLENVLASHPLIETFEETQALFVATDRIESALLGKAPAGSHEAIFLAARAGYFDEVPAAQARRHRADRQAPHPDSGHCLHQQALPRVALYLFDPTPLRCGLELLQAAVQTEPGYGELPDDRGSGPPVRLRDD